jgi:hypothetical protein
MQFGKSAIGKPTRKGRFTFQVKNSLLGRYCALPVSVLQAIFPHTPPIQLIAVFALTKLVEEFANTPHHLVDIATFILGLLLGLRSSRVGDE